MKNPNAKMLLKKLGLNDFESEEIIKRLKREPNVFECYLFSGMWSEHCGYKHSKKYLKMLPKNNSLYSDENAGGVLIGEHIIFFKTESHNHPSAIEPYQGAATGIGGIVRDILSLGARPFALLDSLKFANIAPVSSFSCADFSNALNPASVSDSADIKRAKYLLDGVVEGISDYGNSIGVPTIGGEAEFNSCYQGSPLVNVFASGMVHKNNVKLSGAKKNSFMVLIGSLTGRDGLFGASFASKELNVESAEERSCVQIGDPYTKKNLIEATLKILKSDNVFSCQDLGAAGVLSATSEMAYKGGVGVDLYVDKVPLRQADMEPYEIMLSESQERMLFCSNKTGCDEILEISKENFLCAAVIGKTNDSNRYRVFHKTNELCDLPVEILSECVEYDLKSKEPDYIKECANLECRLSMDIKEAVFKMVSNPNFASKKNIFERYDYTVQNRTALTPESAGAAALWLREEDTYVAFTMDSNPTAVFLNPYEGTKNTVYECMRNLVSSGFRPLGLTNCLNFGNPKKTEVAYQFVQSINGLKDACNALNIPVVSGNVSFYNESCAKTGTENDYKSGMERVYPTPVIAMVGSLEGAEFIKANAHLNDTLYLVGEKINCASHTGSSLYERVLFNFTGGIVDKINYIYEKKLSKTIFSLNHKKLVTGAMDVSKGGLLGTLLIMLFHSKLGFKAQNHDTFLPDLKLLFGEINGRYIISTKDSGEFEKFLNSTEVEFEKLGSFQNSDIDLGFARFNFEQLAALYYNSLEGFLQASL